MGRPMPLCCARGRLLVPGARAVFVFQIETEKEKLNNENKNKIVHRHVIYQNFQKKIS
jgi:hypothetical protein